MSGSYLLLKENTENTHTDSIHQSILNDASHHTHAPLFNSIECTSSDFMVLLLTLFLANVALRLLEKAFVGIVHSIAQRFQEKDKSTAIPFMKDSQ